MSARESTPALWIRLSLVFEGETGWTEAPESNADHGTVVLVKRDERIEYSHKFNGGDSTWFCTDAPDRLRDKLPEPFRLTRSP